MTRHDLTEDGITAPWTHRKKISARRYAKTDWNITVEWEVVDGALTPIGLTIRAANGESAITREVVNALPVGTYIEDSRRAQSAVIEFFARTETGRAGAAARKAKAGTKVNAPRGPGRPKKYDDDHYAALAAAYREARTSRTPTQDVADKFGLTPAVARRHLTKARKMGLLTEGKR